MPALFEKLKLFCLGFLLYKNIIAFVDLVFNNLNLKMLKTFKGSLIIKKEQPALLQVAPFACNDL